MAAAKLQVLVIQLRVADGNPIRDALAANGFDPDLTRVDHEPALHEALARTAFDVLIYVETPSLPLATVHECMRSTGKTMPIVIASDITALGTQVEVALAAHRSDEPP